MRHTISYIRSEWEPFPPGKRAHGTSNCPYNINMYTTVNGDANTNKDIADKNTNRLIFTRGSCLPLTLKASLLTCWRLIALANSKFDTIIIDAGMIRKK